MKSQKIFFLGLLFAFSLFLTGCGRGPKTEIVELSYGWEYTLEMNGYHKSAVLKTPIKKVDYDTIHKRIQRTGNFIV